MRWEEGNKRGVRWEEGCGRRENRGGRKEEEGKQERWEKVKTEKRREEE